jgi:hypothetical protein
VPESSPWRSGALLAEPCGAMCPNVFANRFRHTVVDTNFAQVVDSQVGQEEEHPRQRREGIADQREAQRVVMRPPFMLSDELHNDGWRF